jgi:hypothetical protein
MPQVLQWKPEVCQEILKIIMIDLIDLCVGGTALYVPLGTCSRDQMEIHGREMTVEGELLSAEG